MKNSRILSQIMTLANQLAKIMDRSSAMKKAWMYIKAKVKSLTGVAKVVFIKKNGEERTMNFTTDFTRIPENKRPKSCGFSKLGYQRCWDVEKQAWRAFNAWQIKL